MKPVSQITLWIYLALSLLFSALIFISVQLFHFSHFLLFYMIGGFITVGAYRSSLIFLETSILLILWLLLKNTLPPQDMILELSLIGTLIIATAYPIRSRLAFGISALMILTAAVFYGLTNPTPLNCFGGWHYIILITLVVNLYIYGQITVATPFSKPRQIDILLASYSSNTAHLTDLFRQGMAKNGGEQMLHRFHYEKGFDPVLTGDALVIAFPVIGWRPPWPMMRYMIKRLPAGRGKPAFILYSAGGGPENAGIFAWLLLTLKGYRVMGRVWGIYPLNVPTVRLGPARMWAFLDRLIPTPRDMAYFTQVGEDFSAGLKTGQPFLFWPFPLILAGLFLENPWINHLYRNHLMRKRCHQCNICVNSCPSEKLSGRKDYPKKNGSCSLCLGCVNTCPKNAMHIWGFTEYGNPYKPRWPKWLVRSKDKVKPGSKSLSN